MQSPHIDRRMIEALADHFTQLVTAVLRFLSGHTVYKRYLRPNNQPQAVTTRIQIIGLLIVGKTNGCRTDIHDRSQIEIMVFVLQGTSQPPPVLMTGNTIHRIFLTIQIETFAGNNFIFTQPQRLYHFINHLSVFNQTADNLIQIRIFTSLPQSRFLYRKRRFISLLTLCRQFERLAVSSHLLSFLIVNRILQSNRNGLQSSVVELYLHFYICLFLRYILLGDINTGRCTIGHTYITRFSNNQPHRTINTAIYAKQIMINRDHIGA